MTQKLHKKTYGVKIRYISRKFKYRPRVLLRPVCPGVVYIDIDFWERVVTAGHGDGTQRKAGRSSVRNYLYFETSDNHMVEVSFVTRSGGWLLGDVSKTVYRGVLISQGKMNKILKGL